MQRFYDLVQGEVLKSVALHGGASETMAAKKGSSKIDALTALPGVGAATAKKLVTAKLDSVSKVASAGAKKLQDAGLSAAVAKKVAAAAKAADEAAAAKAATKAGEKEAAAKAAARIGVDDLQIGGHLSELLACMAMRDVPWKEHLHGPDRAAILAAYEKEVSALCGPGCVLRELKSGDAEMATARARATQCRFILEFKHLLNNVYVIEL